MCTDPRLYASTIPGRPATPRESARTHTRLVSIPHHVAERAADRAPHERCPCSSRTTSWCLARGRRSLEGPTSELQRSNPAVIGAALSRAPRKAKAPYDLKAFPCLRSAAGPLFVRHPGAAARLRLDVGKGEIVTADRRQWLAGKSTLLMTVSALRGGRSRGSISSKAMQTHPAGRRTNRAHAAVAQVPPRSRAASSRAELFEKPSDGLHHRRSLAFHTTLTRGCFRHVYRGC